jgi:tetratricopeptide (TPR) repeat protein
MRRKTGSAKKNRRRDGSRKSPKDVPVEQLIESADTAMISLDVERAAQLYNQAATELRGSTTQVDAALYVLEKLGECRVSAGDQDGGRQCFEEALSILDSNSKDTNAMAYHETRSNLYLYTGQLSMGQEALNAYQKGVQSLEACLTLVQDNSIAAEQDSDDTEKILKQKLSRAYCTIAELFLTDLCYEDNAETECESYLERALQIKDDKDGEPLADALQTMASLRLSQKTRQMEAVPYIMRAYSKMKVGCEALAIFVGLADDANLKKDDDHESAFELKEVDAANNLPEFEFRCQTAKLLLECTALLRDVPQTADVTILTEATSDADQCLAAAISVLGSLLAQNDEVIEVWFLTGCAFAAKRPPLVDSAKYHLSHAMQMLQEVKKALELEARFADQEDLADLQGQLEENKVQIEDVEAKLVELGVESEDTMEEG